MSRPVMPRIDPEGWNLLIGLRAYCQSRGAILDETPTATLMIPILGRRGIGGENEEVPIELLVNAGREKP